MSSHVGAGPVEGSQVVLERIQVSVMQETSKQHVALSTSSSVLEKGAETTVSFEQAKAFPERRPELGIGRIS